MREEDSRKHVVVLNALGVGGGAAKSEMLISEGWQSLGYNVTRFNLQSPPLNPKGVGKPLLYKVKLGLEKLRMAFLEKAKAYRFGFSENNIGFLEAKDVLELQPDLVHIHWIGQAFMSIPEIGKVLNADVPVIWTMHDEWTFSGGCHYTFQCNHFESNCGNCLYFKKPRPTDLSFHSLSAKLLGWRPKNTAFVSPSQWLTTQAQKSALLKNQWCLTIHNPRPLPQILDKPKNSKFVVGAVAADLSNIYKGGEDLLAVFKALQKKMGSQVEFVVAGEDKKGVFSEGGLDVKCLGYLKSEEEMFRFLNEVDCFCITSLQENYPNVLLEAKLSGLPIIGYNIGGIPEIVGEHGYTFPVGSHDEIAEAGKQIFENSEVWRNRIPDMRQEIKDHNDPLKIAKEYEAVLKKLENNG